MECFSPSEASLWLQHNLPGERKPVLSWFKMPTFQLGNFFQFCLAVEPPAQSNSFQQGIKIPRIFQEILDMPEIRFT